MHYLTFDHKLTQNVAQYPLHHVTYSPVKFEAATSNVLGGDAFTRKVRRKYVRTDRLWYEINKVPFFREKSGYNIAQV